MKRYSFLITPFSLAIIFGLNCHQTNSDMNHNSMKAWKETMLDKQEPLNIRVAAADSLLFKLVKKHPDFLSFQNSASQWFELTPAQWMDMSMAQVLPIARKPDCKTLMGQLPIPTGEGNAAIYLSVSIDKNTIEAFVIDAKVSGK
jgi:hypothetical protein